MSTSVTCSYQAPSTSQEEGILRIFRRCCSSLHTHSKMLTDRKRPFVTVTYAQSVDGSVSSSSSFPLLLSSPESLKATHILRRLHDSICVGIRTALTDDPRLTSRFGNEYFKNKELKHPRPVLLDTLCKAHTDLKIISEEVKGRENPFVVCSHSTCLDEEKEKFEARQQVLKNAGCCIVECKSTNYRIDLEDALSKLYDAGVKSLMVEGGARIIESFLHRMDLVNQIIVTISPQYVGGLKALNTLLPMDENKTFPRLKNVEWIPVDEDVILYGDVQDDNK